jgi:hypothetical protein
MGGLLVLFAFGPGEYAPAAKYRHRSRDNVAYYRRRSTRRVSLMPAAI